VRKGQAVGGVAGGSNVTLLSLEGVNVTLLALYGKNVTLLSH
jgi:hypothetical protein